MAPRRQKDLINRLADVGEEAFSRVAGSQTTARVLEGMTGMRERLDDVHKKMRGLDALERRVVKLEKRLDSLEKPRSGAGRPTPRSGSAKSPAKKATGTRATGTASRPAPRKKPKPSS